MDLTKSKYEQEKKWEAYGLDPLDLSDTMAGQTANDIIHTKAKAISASQFTVWTSMLKRSTESANDFSTDDYDIKVRGKRGSSSGCHGRKLTDFFCAL